MSVRSGQPSNEPGELLVPAIPSIYAAHLVQLAARWQISAQVLLEGTGLTEAQLDDSQARVSPFALRLLFQRSIELTKERGLGFYFGLQLKLSSHGSVGFAAMTSATLREALHVAERFLALRAPFLSLRVVESGESAALELGSVFPDSSVHVFVTEALFTALIQMARSVLGRPIGAMFELSYPEPAHFAGFAHLWPGPARFGRPLSRICFAPSILDESLQMADPVAARQALVECERELGSLLATSSLLASVRRQLGARDRGYPSLTELARERHVSPRTMKRRLAEQGTSYQKLLDEIRRDRSLKLLEVESTTIEQIAEQLGYSDAANFNRAFRRWLGVSPSVWRDQHVRARAEARAHDRPGGEAKEHSAQNDGARGDAGSD
ncbi:MAG: Transcriptional regulator, AraC family protein [Myxococcaceae bacterium]|nr:Transcriptional regulator, AraC family protein [Myxococcaceae bacterium]